MSKLTFSNALFEQIGGTNWQQRSEFIFASVISESHDAVNAESSPALEPAQAPIEDSFEEQSEPCISKGYSIVVLGAGLNEIWQNDAQPAWLLWQNIMQVFEWDEHQIVFFDTAHMVSEEVVFSTIEEIIDLGVDWALTMDEAHELSEQLQEGIQVISVPDMESMLSDPYAKQTFYHTVISIQNAH